MLRGVMETPWKFEMHPRLLVSGGAEVGLMSRHAAADNDGSFSMWDVGCGVELAETVFVS